jgi:excisionase family DNA binding protein
MAEAAEYLRTTKWRIAELIRSGDLTYTQLGKRFIIAVSDLDDLFRRLSTSAIPRKRR